MMGCGYAQAKFNTHKGFVTIPEAPRQQPMLYAPPLLINFTETHGNKPHFWHVHILRC
jgi:hypothetical protein